MVSCLLFDVYRFVFVVCGLFVCSSIVERGALFVFYIVCGLLLFVDCRSLL